MRFEQLGYQAESGPWRNFYLAGAKELREGTMSVGLNRPAGQADMLGAMPMDMIFDLLGVRLDAACPPNTNGCPSDGT